MSAVTKKKLKLDEAADQWLSVKKQIDELKPQLEEAAEVLKAHFEKTGRRSYKGRIGLNTSTSLILDQPAVRAFLGARLSEFQKRITKRSLTPLGDE